MPTRLISIFFLALAAARGDEKPDQRLAQYEGALR